MYNKVNIVILQFKKQYTFIAKITKVHYNYMGTIKKNIIGIPISIITLNYYKIHKQKKKL